MVWIGSRAYFHAGLRQRSLHHCSHWFTRDPETAIHNIGNYRGQIKARRRIGVFPSGLGQDIYLHWKKAQAKGQHLPAALVIGAPPVVSYVSVQKSPMASTR